MTRRTIEFSCAVVLIGLLAGVAGAATTLLLDFVEHLTYHYSFGNLLDGVAEASPVRRVLGPMIGAALMGAGWWWLRRRTEVPSVEQAIVRPAPLPRAAMTLDAALQIGLVGSGASLGRENAPRQFAVALGDLCTGRWALTARDREILLGCAAGAGLAAVYSVPIGGALFALRIVLRTWDFRAVLTALVTSGLAALVAAPFVYDGPLLHWPNPQLSYLLTGVVVLLAPLTVGVGMAFSTLMRRARARAAERGPRDSWRLIPALGGAGLLLGLCSLWLPELPGNGSSVLLVSVERELGIAAAAAILLLKPLLTAAFLRAGAAGGLITPALATGASLGALIALAVNAWTPLHLNVPAVALACAAAVLAITQGTPGWAAVFVWELASPPLWLLAVFGAAALSAHLLHRRLIAAEPEGDVLSR